MNKLKIINRIINDIGNIIPYLCTNCFIIQYYEIIKIIFIQVVEIAIVE